MTTPSWDFIRASSWRTLMKHGCAPMTCSAWRYITSAKRTRAWQEACGGKVEDGVPTPVRPKPFFDLPVIHHSEKKKTAPDCSHRKKTCRHMSFCNRYEMCSFAESPPVHRSDPCPMPTCMKLRSLNITGPLDKGMGEGHINPTVAVWSYFSC